MEKDPSGVIKIVMRRRKLCHIWERVKQLSLKPKKKNIINPSVCLL